MDKIRERIRYLEAQEQAAQEKRERRNELMRADLDMQVSKGVGWTVQTHVRQRRVRWWSWSRVNQLWPLCLLAEKRLGLWVMGSG